LTTREVHSRALIELYVDYEYKEYFFSHCEMFRQTCRSKARGQSLGFHIPMGELQLSFNWNCQAFWQSCVITPFGHFLGCCRQATGPCCVGPQAGLVTELAIRRLFEKSLRNESLGFFHRCERGNTRSNELAMIGITCCPVEQVFRNKANGGS
jgi:hypothetical protein